ncbi:MAG: serine racemase VanT catalytic subunit [Clostridiales bacterium]|nr:serine racemase VanT catalytic subunit [Clostridiales bacterium]
MYQTGRAWIELNIDNLAYNVKQFQQLIYPSCKIMPAIKANAYGHGADLIGKSLQDMGIQDFCVATVDEAIELRKAGITGQILILGYTSPYRFSDLSHYCLTQTVVDRLYAKQLNDYGQPLYVHIGIDTGMHRLGERSDNHADIGNIWKFNNLRITGVFSHLCVSDDTSDTGRQFTLKQIAEFNSVIDSLHKQGINGFKTHIQGSYGVLNYPSLNYDYARLGIALYGVLSSPYDKTVSSINLKPVLSLKARIQCVKPLHTGESIGYGLTYTAEKEMKIAAVAIGYADGIPRELSNKGYALVNGEKVPIIGRICMDQLLIDVSNLSLVSSGDEVVFIGKSRDKEILASEFANHANTISNEILSRLGNRLERIIVKNKMED